MSKGIKPKLKIKIRICNGKGALLMHSMQAHGAHVHAPKQTLSSTVATRDNALANQLELPALIGA